MISLVGSGYHSPPEMRYELINSYLSALFYRGWDVPVVVMVSLLLAAGGGGVVKT